MASSRFNPNTGMIEVRAYAGKDPITGKVRNLFRSLPGDSEPEVVIGVCAELQEQADALKGRSIPFTVKSAIEYYFDCIASDHSATTMDAYRSNARCYVYPFIGDRRLDDLQPFEITRLYQRLIDKGGKDENPVSNSTVAKLHAWLKPAFDYLVGLGIAGSNPFSYVKRPRENQEEAFALSEIDLAVLMDYLYKESDPDSDDFDMLNVALLLCLNTGVRRGELAGFRVGDYKSRTSSISVKSNLVQTTKGLVRKVPKSKHSRRNISLPVSVSRVIDDYLVWQRGMLDFYGMNQRNNTPLFCDKDGVPIHPRMYAKHLRYLVGKLKLDKSIHLHTLRHTHATALLDLGVNIKTISERLGHSDVGVTLRIYSHVLPGRDEQAANTFSEAVMHRDV